MSVLGDPAPRGRICNSKNFGGGRPLFALTVHGDQEPIPTDARKGTRGAHNRHTDIAWWAYSEHESISGTTAPNFAWCRTFGAGGSHSSVCSEVAKASSTSIPRYRTVLSNWNGQVKVGLRADSPCAYRSATPSSDAASECRRRSGPGRSDSSIDRRAGHIAGC